MPRKSSPILARTVEFVESILWDEAIVSDGVLPAMTQLSALANVSPVTMWKAVNVLKERGVLSGKYGGKIYVVGSRAHQDSKARRKGQSGSTDRSWQRVKKTIERDIFDGVYAPNERLPLMKVLQRRCNASFQTVKRALGALCDERLIQPFGRGYVVTPAHTRRGHARVVLLGQTNREGRIARSVGGDEFFRALEAQCIQSGVKLDVLTYRHQEDKLAFGYEATGMPFSFRDRDDILGVIFLEIEVDSRFEEVIRALSHTALPVAVFTHKPDTAIPRTIRRRNLFRVFFIGVDHYPGRKVGRFLRRQGYSHVGFVSPFHGTAWSRARCEALEEVFSSEEGENRVHRFTIDDFIDSSFHPGLEQAPLVQRTLDSFEEWKRSIDPVFHGFLDDPVKTQVVHGELFRRCLPLFESAMGDERIGAWVCANDFVATIALRFFEERGVAAGDRPFLVSFDDTHEMAVRHRITSYNFNFPVLVTHLLNFILRRDRMAFQSVRRPVVVDGIIMERR